MDTLKVVHQPGIKQVEVKQTVTSHQPGEKWGQLCRIPGVLPDGRGKPQTSFSRIQVLKELPVKQAGSSFERQFSLPDWDYKQAAASYRDHSYYCMAYHVKPAGKRILLAVDFQIALILLSIIALNPNEDKQLPTELVKSLWDKVAKKLGRDRAFDYSRWAAIRNTLSNCQLLTWHDNRYWFYEDDDKKGKAMQWELAPQFCLNSTDTSPTPQDTHTLGGNCLKGVPPGYQGLRPELYLQGRNEGYDLARGERLLEEMFSG
jgi:hypothetical protein